MKKKNLIVVSCVCLAVAVLLGIVLGRVFQTIPFEKTTQTQTELQTQTTEKKTTKAPPSTKKETTQKPTEEKPVIDLNSLTIIDLYPLSLAGGKWDVKHCQGIAVDKENGFVYYSYTTVFVKCDFDGNIVGTITGIKGHLGDIAYNPKDGKIYSGYYSENRTGFYCIIIDADKVTKKNMKPTADIIRSVYLKDPYEDYKATVTLKTGSGENEKETKFLHRYGTSGVDGTTFGPDFSKKRSGELLTISQGNYVNPERSDNNYQILLQYDVSSWWSTYAKPMSSIPHRSGPAKYTGRYFLFTGMTKFGAQTLEYFDELNLWMLNCYKTTKSEFNPYTLFVIDGDVSPKKQKITGQQSEETQYVLSLYQDGEHDKKHDIYGFYSRYGTQGIAYMGDGLFYVVRPYKTWTGIKTAICYLCVWTPEKKDPFTIAAGIDNDYSISKKKRIETTAPPETTRKSSILSDIVSAIAGK